MSHEIYEGLLEELTRRPEKIPEAVKAALITAQQSEIPSLRDELQRERNARKDLEDRLNAQEAQMRAAEDEVAHMKRLLEAERHEHNKTKEALREGGALVALGWSKSAAG